MVDFVLNAEARDDVGKGASRRLRRNAEKVPAVVYGGDIDPVSISLTQKDLSKALENEAFYSHLITLNVGDNSEEVILKDLQRHPSKALIMHADFLRVSKDRLITVNVPLHFINEDKCHGVRQEGGMIQHNVNELEISCLPQNLPEYIEVDMKDVQMGDGLRISDLTLPEEVTSIALTHGEEYDVSVAVVLAPRSEVEPSDEEEGEEPIDGAAPVEDGDED